MFHVQYFVCPDGSIAESSNRAAWLEARRSGVTATDARKLVRLNGQPSLQRERLLEAKLYGDHDLSLPAFEYGLAREPVIAEWVYETFGIVHNSALCVGGNHRHLATPDGIGDGVICEIKTSRDPLSKAVRIYRDQLQWQLHVTRSERVLFVVENSVSQSREDGWVVRDEHRIATLVRHAGAFLEELDARRVSLSGYTPVVSAHATLVRRAPAEREADPPALVVGAPREWPPVEVADLIQAYANGATLPSLAEQLDATTLEVVLQLVAVLLNVEPPVQDPSARRFGQAWTDRELHAVMDGYYDGVWLPGLAHRLGRDQLGVAFKLFEMQAPMVPLELLDPLA